MGISKIKTAVFSSERKNKMIVSPEDITQERGSLLQYLLPTSRIWFETLGIGTGFYWDGDDWE